MLARLPPEEHDRRDPVRQQGSERQVVVISCVRANARAELGFLRDARRLNVALTRARDGLIVVGDSRTLAHGTGGEPTNEFEDAAVWSDWCTWISAHALRLDWQREGPAE